MEQIARLIEEVRQVDKELSEVATQKRSTLGLEIESVFASLADTQPIETKAQVWYLKGCVEEWAYRYGTSREAFVRAAKLDPTLYVAWNKLGDDYCRGKDFTNARHCFQNAITASPNKESLRQMSIVLRQLGVGDELRQNVKLSIEKAKEAISLDMKDHLSWYVLGNAYLAHFFRASFDSSDLNLSLKAYKQSEHLGAEKKNADLYFNRATVFRFLEDFSAALTDLKTAESIDSSWTQPSGMMKDILDFLKRIHENIQKKGFMRPKKFQSMLDAIPSNGKTIGDVTKDSDAHSETILLKLVAFVSHPSQVPLSVLVVDKYGQFAVLSLRNLASENVRIGDLLSVNKPHIKEVRLNMEEQEFSYTSISVERLDDVLINQRPIETQKQSQPTLKVELI